MQKIEKRQIVVCHRFDPYQFKLRNRSIRKQIVEAEDFAASINAGGCREGIG